MKYKFKISTLLSLLLGAIVLSGCASSTSSVVPTQTWQPAAVSEINYQDWQSRVNRYSEKLTLILGRSSNDKITK